MIALMFEENNSTCAWGKQEQEEQLEITIQQHQQN
jgi:hypothetical protein